MPEYIDSPRIDTVINPLIEIHRNMNDSIFDNQNDQSNLGSYNISMDHSLARQSVMPSIDIDLINQKLTHVNTFAERRQGEKIQPILMYEITSSGESEYKSMTLRELLVYVNEEAYELDRIATERKHSISSTKGTSMDFSAIEKQQRLAAHNHSISKQSEIYDISKITTLYPTISSSTIRSSSLQPSNIESQSSFHSSSTSSLPKKQTNRENSKAHHSIGGINIMEGSVTDNSQSISNDHNLAIYNVVGDLRLRDLRRLDFQFNPNEERSVLIRRHAVLFAMDPIRAVVMSTRLILIVPNGADSLISILDKYMKEWVDVKEVMEELTSPSRDSSMDNNDVSNNSESRHLLYKQQQQQQHDSTGGGKWGSNTNTASGDYRHNKSYSSKQSSRAIVNKIMNTIQSYHNRHITSGGTLHHTTSTSSLNLKEGDEGYSGEHYIDNDDAVFNIDPVKIQTAVSAIYEMPFEAHAYEALLTTVEALETQEFQKINQQVQVILSYFRTKALLPIEVQEHMRTKKNELSVMKQRISTCRSALYELTDDDEQMALMNLSYLKKKPSLYHYPLLPEILTKHDDIEELLESYLIDFNHLESKILTARNQIQSAEELMSLRLDTSRNELLFANTSLSILAVTVAFGGFVAGIFGMNLDNTLSIQSTANSFVIVISGTIALMILILYGLITYLGRNGMFQTSSQVKNRDVIILKK